MKGVSTVEIQLRYRKASCTVLQAGNLLGDKGRIFSSISQWANPLLQEEGLAKLRGAMSHRTSSQIFIRICIFICTPYMVISALCACGCLVKSIAKFQWSEIAIVKSFLRTVRHPFFFPSIFPPSSLSPSLFSLPLSLSLSVHT